MTTAQTPALPGSLGDLSVLVLGTGVSGRSMASWCRRQGARVVVADPRGAGPEVPCLAGIDAVLMSPGISPRGPDAAPVLAAAAAAGIPVASELDLFAAALAKLAASSGYAPEVVAITGTNGKTTTTALTAALLNASGRRQARVAGNIGPALMDELSAALDDDALPDTWVLELSSFQLSYGRNFAASVGVLLNVTPDHLDWHGGFADYERVKLTVLTTSAKAIVCREDVAGPRPPASTGTAPTTTTFGIGVPHAVGDYGVSSAGPTRWLVQRGTDGRLDPIVAVESLRITGDHLLLDALAAVAVVDATCGRTAATVDALVAYEGEAHRNQLVARSGSGVLFVDDGKATNVAAVCAALAARGTGGQAILILGGEGKGQSFLGLRDAVATHARHVLTLGRAAAQIEQDLSDAGVPLERVGSLPTAVDRAWELARPGDVVLLSPACASTDAFADYTERSACFRAAVHAIVTPEGVEAGGP